MIDRHFSIFRLLLLVAAFGLNTLGVGLFCSPAVANTAQLTELETLQKRIERASKLPGAELLAKQSEQPVVVWIERATIAIDNLYGDSSPPYIALKVSVGNATDQTIELSQDDISLQVDKKTHRISDTILEFSPQIGGDHIPVSELTTPQNISIPSQQAATFWCLFTDYQLTPGVPQLTLKLAVAGGEPHVLNVSEQLGLRLGLQTRFIGPEKVIRLITIHGPLNPVNSSRLAQEFETAIREKTERILIEWSPRAPATDEVLLSWLVNSTKSSRRYNLQIDHLPSLPKIRQVCLTRLPRKNRDLYEDYNSSEEFESHLFKQPADAVTFMLADVFQRVSPRTLLREIRSGHVWSRNAALSTAGHRLDSSALPTLLALSHDDNRDLRKLAILALGFQQSPEAQARLKSLATTSAQTDAATAFQSLLAADHPQNKQTVLQMLNSDSLLMPAEEVISLLAEYYQLEWNAYLIESTSHSDGNARSAALDVLAHIQHPDIIPLSMKALNDSELAVRESAFNAISTQHQSLGSNKRIADELAVKYLRSGEFGYSTISYLEKIQDQTIVPLLVQQISNRDLSQSLASSIVRMLGELGTSEQIRDCLIQLKSYSPAAQSLLLQLVTTLSPEDQLQVLRTALVSEHSDVRSEALSLLSNIESSQTIDLIAQHIGNISDDDFGSICHFLADAGTQQAVERLYLFRTQAFEDEASQHRLHEINEAITRWKMRLPGWSYFESGTYLAQTDEIEQAKRAFSLAIEINDKLSDAYVARGNLLLRQEDFEQAGNDFRKAFEIDPDDGQAITGIAIIDAVNGDLEKGLELVNSRSKQFPNDIFFLYNTACVYGRAIEYLNKQPATQERDQKIQDFETIAVSKLRESISLGFDQLSWMKEDPDLKSLHHLKEFQELGPML